MEIGVTDSARRIVAQSAVRKSEGLLQNVTSQCESKRWLFLAERNVQVWVAIDRLSRVLVAMMQCIQVTDQREDTLSF
ncbi:hypothetical protein [Mycoavidus sp. B2-EB]|uniref:hypothetical protein n=1 Tax=Mycoavidus sp. B2-EB TaxID=2651972 RepID=UPI00162AEC00|nr:hypothetical protein [Mycoavidus sp. B2-EB]